jgi:hypothetical protein
LGPEQFSRVTTMTNGSLDTKDAMKLAERLADKFQLTQRFFQTSAWVLFFSVLGCAKSSHPSINELIKTRPPTFQNRAERNYTTSSNGPFVLNGECDPISYGLQYSYDKITWTELSGGCAGKRFSITITLSSYSHVWVRARTKKSFTSAAHAFVRMVLPPTSPAFSLAVSGHAGAANTAETQNSVGYSFTAVPMDNGVNQLWHDIVGIVYGE